MPLYRLIEIKDRQFSGQNFQVAPLQRPIGVVSPIRLRQSLAEKLKVDSLLRQLRAGFRRTGFANVTGGYSC
jgi:hypothetical protein